MQCTEERDFISGFLYPSRTTIYRPLLYIISILLPSVATARCFVALLLAFLVVEKEQKGSAASPWPQQMNSKGDLLYCPHRCSIHEQHIRPHLLGDTEPSSCLLPSCALTHSYVPASPTCGS